MRLLLVGLMACTGADRRCPEVGAADLCDGDEWLSCVDGRLEDRETCEDATVCVADAGCVPCAPILPAGPLSVPIELAPDPVGLAWRTLGWTPIRLDGAGDATVAVSGPVALFDAQGNPLAGVTLPVTVYAVASGAGPASITVEAAGCGESATVELVPRVWPGLAAIELPSAPHATWVDAFVTGATLRVAVDPARFPDKHGSGGQVFVVADRDREAWVTDPGLVDVAGGPQPFTVGSGGLASHVLSGWAPLQAAPGARVARDVVWDVDGDGQLSPGDVLDGLDGPGFVVWGDLAAPGPHAVLQDEVSSSFWVTQRVWWPADLSSFPAPAPLVVISHGNGHEYTWYDYLGEHLASHGYVVMSHRNNTQPGVESAATTTLDNTDAFVRNHALIDPMLEGRVDVHAITWIGHSRGGEGVLLAYARLVDGVANVQSLQAGDIALISSIAPTVFTGPAQATPGDRPYHQLAGSADGDVTGGVGDPFGFPCPLCQWFRLRQGGTGLQAVTYLQGAAHNDFCALGFDDGQGLDVPRYGDKPEVQATTRATYLALIDAVVRGDPTAGEFLSRHPDSLSVIRPAGAVLSTQLRPAPADVRAIDDFQLEPDPAVSSAGMQVRSTLTLTEGVLDDGNARFAHTPADAFNGMTESHDDLPALAARGVVFGWDGDAVWEVDVPLDAADFTRARALSLRVAQSTRHPATTELGDALSFGIALVDGSGREIVLDSANYGGVAAPSARAGLGAGRGWANEFTTLRVGLEDFEFDNFDRGNVRTVRLRFGPTWGSPTGRIGLDDVLLEVR